MHVRAQVFEEPQAKTRHIFCVGATAETEEFLFFISMDTGDKSSNIWRVSSEGKLVATSCFAGSATKSVPNSELEAKFLVEKEYFLRTFRLVQPPPDLLTDPEPPK